MAERADLLDDFRDRIGVPAVIGGVVDRTGHVEFDVVGHRRRNQLDDAATIDDRWHIGSCGKSMTAALYGCLVEAGLAEWGTAIGSLFGDIAGQPLLSSETVEHLLASPADAPRSMAMGWAPAYGLDGAAFGMQGSNTLWSATALVDDDLGRTAMVVVNDGRTKVLQRSAQLAYALLQTS